MPPFCLGAASSVKASSSSQMLWDSAGLDFHIKYMGVVILCRSQYPVKWTMRVMGKAFLKRDGFPGSSKTYSVGYFVAIVRKISKIICEEFSIFSSRWYGMCFKTFDYQIFLASIFSCFSYVCSCFLQFFPVILNYLTQCQNHYGRVVWILFCNWNVSKAEHRVNVNGLSASDAYLCSQKYLKGSAATQSLAFTLYLVLFFNMQVWPSEIF